MPKDAAKEVVELTPRGRIVRTYAADGTLLGIRREPVTSGPTSDAPPVSKTQLPERAQPPAEKPPASPEPKKALRFPTLGRKRDDTKTAAPEPAPEAAPVEDKVARLAALKAQREALKEAPAPAAAPEPEPEPTPPPPKRFRVIRAEAVAPPEPAPEPEPAPPEAAPPAEPAPELQPIEAPPEPAPEPVVEERPASQDEPAQATKRWLPFGGRKERAKEETPVAEEAPKEEKAKRGLGFFARKKKTPAPEPAPSEETPVATAPAEPETAPAPETAERPPEPERVVRASEVVPDVESRVDSLLAARSAQAKRKKRAPLPVPEFSPLEDDETQRKVDALLKR